MNARRTRIRAPSLGPGSSIALSLLHAVLYAASYPNANLWPLAFVSLIPLTVLAMGARSARQAALLAFMGHFVLWLWMNRWVIPVTAVGYPAMCAYLALYGPLYVLIIRRVARHRKVRRLSLAVIVPVVWVGLECLRGEFVFHGYAWYLLGHPLVEWPVLAQTADLWGAYGVSFMVAAVNGLLVDLGRSRTGRKMPAPVRRSAAAVVALLVLCIAYGIWRSQPLKSSAGAADLSVLVIQTNLPQDNKVGWTIEQQDEDVPQFIEQTRQAVRELRDGGHAIDLIVWPETMVPGGGFESDTIALLERFGEQWAHLHTWSRAVVDLAIEFDTPMLVGSPAWVGPQLVTEGNRARLERDHDFNSAYLIDPTTSSRDGATGGVSITRYDKHFLTPFGETMPYISAWPWLEQKLLALGAGGMSFNLDAADDVRTLAMLPQSSADAPGETASAPISLATPICFEDTVARVVRAMIRTAPRADRAVLINLSNDGWFGSHDACRTQHAQMARFRCIENRVPMVRSVNTGKSIHIDSRGFVVGRVGEGRYGSGRQSGVLHAQVSFDGRSTLYQRIGDWLAWLCVALTVALLAATLTPRRRADR